MDKRSVRTLLDRIKQTCEEYARELFRATQVKDSKGKSQASKIRRQQIISRIQHLSNQLKSSLLSGNILEVTYIHEVEGKPIKKYKGILSDVSKADFEYFIQTMNSTRDKDKLVILEIREIPTFIKEVPL